MGSGQIGSLNVGQEIGTSPTSPDAPDQVLGTKQSTEAVAASTAFNTYDLVYPWGVAQSFVGWGISGGASDPINVLNAYPHLFPTDVIIQDIIIKNQVGAAATRYRVGIYSNIGNGVIYPNAKLVENVEQNPLATGVTTWSPGLVVKAGTLLWIVHTCDNTAGNINLASMLMSASLVLGTEGNMLNEAIIAWQQTQTYDGTLPLVYPTTPPTALRGGTHVAPAFMMRYSL